MSADKAMVLENELITSFGQRYRQSDVYLGIRYVDGTHGLCYRLLYTRSMIGRLSEASWVELMEFVLFSGDGKAPDEVYAMAELVL